MNGGIVVNVYEEGDFQVIECRERDTKSRCSVRIPKGYCVDFGDSIWWQGKKVFWTPANGSGRDRPIPKIGYSFSERKDG